MAEAWETIVEQFGLRAADCRVAPLGNAGGFSGARLWRIADSQGTWCLRRWPREQDRGRLRFIHAVQELAGGQVDFVPRLRRAGDGDTVLEAAGYAWELTNWRPGEADEHGSPSVARLRAALAALARLHLALEPFPTRVTGPVASPGVRERRARLAGFRHDLPALQTALASAPEALQQRGAPILAAFAHGADRLEEALAAGETLLVPLQPVLRDIWSAHVLFTGEEVTGIVDFGAARIDSVAYDLARLIGSLAGNDRSAWREALASYEHLRPLSTDETRLMHLCDRSGVLLGGLQWLVWLLLEGRAFPDPAAVYARLDALLSRLQSTHKGDFLSPCD